MPTLKYIHIIDAGLRKHNYLIFFNVFFCPNIYLFKNKFLVTSV